MGQINPKLKIGNVFLTMANEANARMEILQSVKENCGKHLSMLNAAIPATVRLAEVSISKEAELAEKTAWLKKLNILLNLDQEGRSMIDDAPEEDTPDKPKPRGVEQ